MQCPHPFYLESTTSSFPPQTQLLGVGGEQEWLKGIPLFKTFHKKDQTVHGFPIHQEPIQRLKFSLINAKNLPRSFNTEEKSDLNI